MKYAYFFHIIFSLYFFSFFSGIGVCAKQSTREHHQDFAGEQAKTTDKAQWTIYVFMEGRNNLNLFARKDIYRMSQVGSNENLTIIVQAYQPHSPAMRYKIEKRKIVELERVATTGNITQDFIMGMERTVADFPAHHYCVVLWDHGLASMELEWDFARGCWSVDTDFSVEHTVVKDNPRFQIPGVTCGNAAHRGILFNEENRTYMTNKDMLYAFNEIKNKVLKGKKIDVIGMDACLMANLETYWNIKDCAVHSTASEDVELGDGLNYPAFLRAASLYPLSPGELAQTIVATYEHYYKPRTELYTQSAIDLRGIDAIKENLDDIVNLLLQGMKENRSGVKALIARARKNSFQLSTQVFIDLHSFYGELLRQLHTSEGLFLQTIVVDEGSLKERLEHHLNDGLKVLEGSVIAKVAGKHLTRAHGVSIYFPRTGLGRWYSHIPFAQASLWSQFLSELFSE